MYVPTVVLYCTHSTVPTTSCLAFTAMMILAPLCSLLKSLSLSLALNIMPNVDWLVEPIFTTQFHMPQFVCTAAPYLTVSVRKDRALTYVRHMYCTYKYNSLYYDGLTTITRSTYLWPTFIYYGTVVSTVVHVS